MKKLVPPASLLLFAIALSVTSSFGQNASFEDLARKAQEVLDTKPAEAADLYKQALAQRPDWTEGWFYLGAALYQTDKYAEATDAFRKVVAALPQHGTAWAFLGLCEAELDDPDQALADIRKGEQLGLGGDKNFEVAVRVKAARLLVKSSSFDEALFEMQPVSRLQVNSQAIEDTMGLCALAVPSKMSELTPARHAVVSLAGKAQWASVTQKPEIATAAYHELLEKYPKEAGVHYAYGLYLLETDLAAALAEFQQEVKNTPNHWPSHIVIASIQLRQGSSDESIATLKQAMKIVPVKYRWLCHAELGRAYLTAQNVETAMSELKTAVRLNSGNPQVHFLLAQALRRSGQTDEAQKETAEFQKLKVQQDPLGVPTFRTFTNTQN